MDDALQGASDIIAEIISDDADLRKLLRELYWRRASPSFLRSWRLRRYCKRSASWRMSWSSMAPWSSLR